MKKNEKIKNKEINTLNPINNYNNIIKIINELLIFFLCIPLSIEHFKLRKIDLINEIILNIKGTGVKGTLCYEYSYPPDEIIINGNSISFSYIEGDSNNYKFQFDLENNIVILKYNLCPISFNKMFKDSDSLIKVDLSRFYTSNVKDMSFMFYGCDHLGDVYLKGVVTSAITNMQSMFENCLILTSLDLSSFDTSEVLTMKNMFYNCNKLSYIDVSSFDTAKVKDMEKMFYNIKGITYLDLSNFRFNNVNTYSMFQNCWNLEKINFAKGNRIIITNIASMFQDCQNLKYVDLSLFDTSSCTRMDYLFDNCYKLVSLDLSNFQTTSTTNFENMFSFCANLKYLDLSNFDTSKVTDMSRMFKGCNFKYLNLKSFTITEDTKIENMLDSSIGETKICYNIEKAGILNSTYDNLNNICDDDCFRSNYKLILDTMICVERCRVSILYGSYPYEYNNICYSKCPNNTVSSTNNEYLCEDELICDYYNLDKTKCFASIPNGYYLYDSQEKTIDECYENCKTCNEKGTEDDNKCLSCQENYYFYNGNCIEHCPKGYYFDNSGKLICSCLEDEKCKECSKESLQEQLCILCNDGYQTIEEDGSNFVFCYKEVDGCYLDKNDKISKKCYSLCKRCFGGGDENNHNCKVCIDNYEFSNIFNKENNCYIKCDNYYYFISENEIGCTETKKCPENSILKNNICEKLTDTPTNKRTDSPTEKVTDMPPTTKPTETPTTKPTETPTTKPTDSPTSKPTDKPTSKDDNTVKVVDWSVEKFFDGLYENENFLDNLSSDDILNNIQDELINGNLKELISEIIEEKEDKCITKNNVLYQITTSENQNSKDYNNISSIKLGECEETLKGIYNIKNETLIILKIDYNITGIKIPIIRYEVYNPRNYSKLNLSYCNDSLVNYNIPVEIDEDNLYKYDPTSDYYNDECNTFTTENGTDILLSDRKNEFMENNMSLCENICEYVRYDNKKKKVICQCGIKYKDFILAEIEKLDNILSNNITVEDSSSNFAAMKCFEFVFTKEGLITNLGNYILLFIILFHCISIIIFYKCGYHIIENIIKQIINDKKKPKKFRNKSNCNIFDLNKNLNKMKKRNTSYNIKPKKERLLKGKKKSLANPMKRYKKKSIKAINFLENTNMSNSKSINNKSINKLNLKEEKIKNRFKNRSRSIKSAKLNIHKKVNKSPKKFILSSYNDNILNNMDYNNALLHDKRSFSENYLSLIKFKQPIIFSFFPQNDYNIFIVKLCLFFLSFAIYYALNTFFFDLDLIHKIYEDKGKYKLSHHLIQIHYPFYKEFEYIFTFLYLFKIIFL